MASRLTAEASSSGMTSGTSEAAQLKPTEPATSKTANKRLRPNHHINTSLKNAHNQSRPYGALAPGTMIQNKTWKNFSPVISSKRPARTCFASNFNGLN
jgi:hypothetical protein